jgi:protein XagA
MKKNNCLIVLTFLIFSTTLSAQWSKGKGKGYYKLSTWSLLADKHYTDTGEIDPNPTRGTLNISFYGEYGLTNKIDLITYIPFFTRNFQNNSVSATRGSIITEGATLDAFGDLDIGVRYGIIKNNSLALSASLKLGLPTGETSGGTELAMLQSGDGEFNQLLQIDLGVPFNLATFPAYGKTFVGYNSRSQGFSDEVHLGGEIGIKFFNKVWLTGRLNLLKSTKNGTLDAAAANGSIFANNIEYTNLGFGIAYYITKKLGVSYDYGSAIDGRIIAAAPSHSVGLFLDIK